MEHLELKSQVSLIEKDISTGVSKTPEVNNTR
jgi:hypothetical protein